MTVKLQTDYTDSNPRRRAVSLGKKVITLAALRYDGEFSTLVHYTTMHGQ